MACFDEGHAALRTWGMPCNLPKRRHKVLRICCVLCFCAEGKEGKALAAHNKQEHPPDRFASRAPRRPPDCCCCAEPLQIAAARAAAHHSSPAPQNGLRSHSLVTMAFALSSKSALRAAARPAGAKVRARDRHTAQQPRLLRAPLRLYGARSPRHRAFLHVLPAWDRDPGGPDGQGARNLGEPSPRDLIAQASLPFALSSLATTTTLHPGLARGSPRRHRVVRPRPPQVPG